MGCLSGSTPTPDTTVQDAMAKISRDEFNRYKQQYSGFARQLGQQANDPRVITDAVKAATDRVDPIYDVQKGVTERMVDRYNMPLTGDQRKLLLQQHNRGKTVSKVNAENTARRSTADLQDTLRGDVIAMGQGQRDLAMANYGTAGQLEAQRNNTNLNNSAQHKAGIAGLASQAAGLAGTALIFSSKTKKKNIKDADKAGASKEMRQLKVKNYEYKDGADANKTRTGVIAEDSTSVATPDKKMVDLGDWTGKLTLAVQDTADKVDGIDQRLLKLEGGRKDKVA